MTGERVKGMVVLGWREWGNRPKVVIYKDLEGFEKFDRRVVWPNVQEIVLDVAD